MVFISIIIPTFNNEKKIISCLKSIFDQNYSDFEVIVIDDGSNDKTEIICEDFNEQYDNFKYFYQSNRGVSAARNKGLSFATGKYILFIDSDDLILPNSLHSLSMSAINNKSDLVVGNYIVRYSDLDKEIYHEATHSPVKFIEGAITGIYHSALWNKLIKRELIGNIKFDEELSYMEDQLFLIDLLTNKPDISFVPEFVYIYNQYHASNISCTSEKSVLSSVSALGKAVGKLNGKIHREYIDLYISRCVLSAILYTNKKYKDVFKYLGDFTISKDLSLMKRVIIWIYINEFNFSIDLIRKLSRLKNG